MVSFQVPAAPNAHAAKLNHNRATRPKMVDQQIYSADDLISLREMRVYNRFIARLFAGALPKHATDGAQRVLDFGAGIGTVTGLFAAETGIKPLALDADATHLNMLRADGFTAVARLDEVQDGTLDYVFSSNVLEHIADDRAILAELHRKLKPGGAIALYVPAFMSLWTRLDDHVGHVRRYTQADLAEKLTAAGFAVESHRYCDSLGYVGTRLFRRYITVAGDINPRTLRLLDRFLFPLSRAADLLFARRFGKNIFIVARRGP